LEEKISVVITTTDRYGDLISCLESVRKSTYKNMEIIIVDDNSGDKTRFLTPARVKKISGITCEIRVIHIRNGRKMMVKARNAGGRAATRKLVLYIDDDNVIEPKMIRQLVSFMKKNPEYGIIGPSMRYGDGKVYMNCQKLGLFSGMTYGIISKNGGYHNESHGVPNVFMVRQEVLEKTGYFDESVICTYSELDFFFQAAKHGYKCSMLKYSSTCHKMFLHEVLTPRGLGGEFMEKSYCLIRNRTLMVMRYGKWYHKLVYTSFFSWLWPVIYSLLIIRFMRFDIVKFYWVGFLDGIRYVFTGRLKNSLPGLFK
jgi:GT2 family glycosyltransferase